MPTERGVIETWLYSTLNDDAALNQIIGNRIFHTIISQSSGDGEASFMVTENGELILTEGGDVLVTEDFFPFVLFGYIAAQDTMYGGSDRAFTTAFYKIDCYSNSSFSDADSAYELVDALIHKGAGAPSGGSVFASVRTQPRQQIEILPGGGRLYLSGGLYRIQARLS